MRNSCEAKRNLTRICSAAGIVAIAALATLVWASPILAAPAPQGDTCPDGKTEITVDSTNNKANTVFGMCARGLGYAGNNIDLCIAGATYPDGRLVDPDLIHNRETVCLPNLNNPDSNRDSNSDSNSDLTNLNPVDVRNQTETFTDSQQDLGVNVRNNNAVQHSDRVTGESKIDFSNLPDWCTAAPVLIILLGILGLAIRSKGEQIKSGILDRLPPFLRGGGY